MNIDVIPNVYASNVNISAPRLKTLTKSLNTDYNEKDGDFFRFYIDAPNLEKLSIAAANFLSYFDLESEKSLVEATVYVEDQHQPNWCLF